jgi:hypothetical protein
MAQIEEKKMKSPVLFLAIYANEFKYKNKLILKKKTDFFPKIFMSFFSIFSNFDGSKY